MSEDKGRARRKRAKTQPKTTQEPKKKHKGGRGRQNGTIKTPISGVLQFHNHISSSNDAVDPTNATIDPFETEFSTQYVIKKDTASYDLTAHQCCKAVEHTKEVVGDESTYPVRQLWAPPSLTEDLSPIDGKITTTLDSRGQFVGITRAAFTFTNVSPEEVKLRGNTPKAIMDQQFDISLRSHEFAVSIKPGAKYVHSVTWRNSKRDSPHYTAKKGNFPDAISLLDYYVLITDIDAQSNTPWDDKALILGVQCTVHYEVEAPVPLGATTVNIKPFGLVTLGSYYGMFNINEPVTGLFSDASKRQISVGGGLQIAVAYFDKAFQTTVNNAPGDYYVAFAASLGNSKYASPLKIKGAAKNAVIKLPIPFLSQYKYGSQYRHSITQLALNIGGASECTISAGDHKGLVLKGDQMWVLCSTTGVAVGGVAFQGTSPTEGMNYDYPELGSEVTVNYWDSWGSSALTGKQNITRLVNAKAEGAISLMTIIFVLEAVSDFVSIVKRLSKSLSKSN